jgi:hypothetical protein
MGILVHHHNVRIYADSYYCFRLKGNAAKLLEKSGKLKTLHTDL